MLKRRNQDSKGRNFDKGDDPIGLSGAFAPIKGPQSVDYDVDDDSIGLTGAFGAITPQELSERPWDDANKWKDFEWADLPVMDVDDEPDLVSLDDEYEDEGADENEFEDPLDEAFDDEDFSDDEDAELEAEAKAETKVEAKVEADESVSSASKSKKNKGSKGAKGKHGRHAAPEPELTPRMKKSKRTRRILIVLLILFAIIIIALGYFAYRTFTNSQQEAAQQTQEKQEQPIESSSIEQTDDATNTVTRLADVPDLSHLLGMTQDEAIKAIGHGALVTSNRETPEDDDSPIRTTINVALTEESADSKTGTPTVYLGLGEDGHVRQAGYSASASALGFSALSFADAVGSEHVIEKTLEKAGVNVPVGAAVLPAEKKDYTSYASDGTTIVRERCSFDGDVEVNGIPCAWSAVLSYDYTTQIVTDNLADTVRIIYIYISEK